MKQKEKKPVEVTKEVVTAIICDGCKQAISENDKDHYFEVATHHSDWGNDSADSFNYLDFCGTHCITKHMVRYFEKTTGTEEYEIERVHKKAVKKK